MIGLGCASDLTGFFSGVRYAGLRPKVDFTADPSNARIHVRDLGATMKARITVNVDKDGEFQIWLNAAGRDQLVAELLALSEASDHFHLGAYKGAEVEMSSVPYNDGDTIFGSGKVFFRTEDWEKQFFPHVVKETSES